MPYWKLFYHIVWSTKNREPLLTSDVEAVVHTLLRNKATALEAVVFALNGTADHVHLVVSIPPKIAVAKFVGQVKGVASTVFNKSDRQGRVLFWQEEYGVFSFDAKRLPNYVAYVQRQKEHHAANTTLAVLERVRDEGVAIAREAALPYAPPGDAWWHELEALGSEFQPD